MTKILAFAGSARRDSFNRQLIAIAAEHTRLAGAEVTLLELRDYPLPLYDGDLEAADGLPANAVKLKQLFVQHQGLLLACPEHNSAITALLKNTIDWVSRSAAGEAPLIAYRGKVAALLSASPGRLGGLRGLVHVRSILGNIGVLVLPDQVAVPKAHEAFTAEHRLVDARLDGMVAKLARELFDTTRKLSG